MRPTRISQSNSFFFNDACGTLIRKEQVQKARIDRSGQTEHSQLIGQQAIIFHIYSDLLSHINTSIVFSTLASRTSKTNILLSKIATMAPLLKILTSTLAIARSVAALPISRQPTRYDLLVRDITAVNTSIVDIPANKSTPTAVSIPTNLTMLNTTISNSTISFLNGKKADEVKQKATQMKEADDHRKAEEKKKQDGEDRKLQEGLKRLEEQKKQEEMKKEEERKQEEAKKAEEEKKADAEKFKKDEEKKLDAKKKNTWAFSAFVGAWTFVAGLVKTLVSAIPGFGNI